jgi:uncharacterized membrane protein
MDSVSEAQSQLDQLRLTAKRQLLGTVVLGVMAGLLAFVGQSALGHARPLLEASFGTWQSLYTVVLWALAIAWLVALAQQAIQNINEQFESRRRLDMVYAERAAKAQAAEEDRQRQRAETDARQAVERTRRQTRNVRSTKFDY